MEDRVPHLHEQDRLDDQGHFRRERAADICKKKNRGRAKDKARTIPRLGCVFSFFSKRGRWLLLDGF